MDDAMSLEEMQKIIRKFCDDRDWDQFHNPKDMALSLTLEAAEVLEHFQWKNEQEIKNHLQANKEYVGEELADALYWVIRMADKFDIDMGNAFNKKMQKNALKYPVAKSRGSHKKYTEHA